MSFGFYMLLSLVESKKCDYLKLFSFSFVTDSTNRAAEDFFFLQEAEFLSCWPVSAELAHIFPINIQVT